MQRPTLGLPKWQTLLLWVQQMLHNLPSGIAVVQQVLSLRVKVKWPLPIPVLASKCCPALEVSAKWHGFLLPTYHSPSRGGAGTPG